MSSVGEGRGTRGFEGVRGKVLGVSVARIRTKGGLQREAGGGRLRGARVCSLLPTGRRKTTSEEVSGLGQPRGPPGGPGGFLSPFQFFFLFSILFLCFDLVIMLNHFVNS